MNTPPASPAPSTPPRTAPRVHVVPFRVQMLRELEQLREVLVEVSDEMTNPAATYDERKQAEADAIELLEEIGLHEQELREWDEFTKTL